MAKITYNRTRKAMELVGANVVGKVKNQLAQDKINATGKTSAATKFNIKIDGDLLTLGFSSRKRLGTDVLGIIQYGRTPSLPPPYKDIAKWIRAKNIPIRGSKRSASAINSVAYGIAQSIGRRGIRPKNVFEKALGGFIPGKGELFILDALGEDLDEWVDENMPKKT